MNLQKGANTMLLSDPGALARLAKDAAQRQQDMMQEEELTEEEKKKKAFEARRKAHYNEVLFCLKCLTQCHRNSLENV